MIIWDYIVLALTCVFSRINLCVLWPLDEVNATFYSLINLIKIEVLCLFIGYQMVSEVKLSTWNTMDNKLVQLLVFNLDFIRKISDFLPDSHSKEEQEILKLLKQPSHYDFAVETLRKLQRKYGKKWF